MSEEGRQEERQRVARTDAELTDKDREFARSFIALHFDLESNVGKAGIEILCRVLRQAREEGRQEERARWISAANGHADHPGAECVALIVRDATKETTQC